MALAAIESHFVLITFTIVETYLSLVFSHFIRGFSTYIWYHILHSFYFENSYENDCEKCVSYLLKWTFYIIATLLGRMLCCSCSASRFWFLNSSSLSYLHVHSTLFGSTLRQLLISFLLFDIFSNFRFFSYIQIFDFIMLYLSCSKIYSVGFMTIMLLIFFEEKEY